MSLPVGKSLGLIVTSAPDIVTEPDETAMVSITVPDALPSLKVIFPLPLAIVVLYVITIFDDIDTSDEPSVGLKVIATGSTSNDVAVTIPAFAFLSSSITTIP